MRGSAINVKINEVYKVPSLELGQTVKISCADINSKYNRSTIFSGNVIFKNDRCITVEGKNYKESFTLNQFRSGEVRLLV